MDWLEDRLKVSEELRCRLDENKRRVSIMSFVWEFIGVWKEQYYAMVQIQFPEFFRSAILVIYAFVTALPVHKGKRITNGAENKSQVDKIECEILYDPPPETWRGDVVIIHGLHGSTTKTWRQGVYESSKVKKIELRRHLSLPSKTVDKPNCPRCQRVKRTHSKDRFNKKSITKKMRAVKSDDDILLRRSSVTNDSFSVQLSTDDGDDYISFTSNVLNELHPKNNIPENICDFDNAGFDLFDRGEPVCDSYNIHYNNHNSDCTNMISGHDDFNRFIDFIEYENERYDPEMKESDEKAFCSCDNGKIEISSGYIDKHHYEKHLKYHIYGNGSLLVRECIFYFKFLVNFAKQLFLLYKKLWDTSNDQGLSSCWPKDWLPLDCPDIRVISINYTTFLCMPIWYKSCDRTSLQQKSLKMAHQLECLGVGKKPIVWAAHSKGGLFIKQMFINSMRQYGGVSRNIFSNTHTIAFYSVPHHGSVLAHLFSPPIVRPSVEIVEIRTGSQMVSKLHDEFREALEEAHKVQLNPYIVSYTETIPTNMGGLLLQIVFPMSADPGVGDFYGIPLDHRMICKFSSRDCLLYKDLIKMIETAFQPGLTNQ